MFVQFEVSRISALKSIYSSPYIKNVNKAATTKSLDPLGLFYSNHKLLFAPALTLSWVCLLCLQLLPLFGICSVFVPVSSNAFVFLVLALPRFIFLGPQSRIRQLFTFPHCCIISYYSLQESNPVSCFCKDCGTAETWRSCQCFIGWGFSKEDRGLLWDTLLRW